MQTFAPRLHPSCNTGRGNFRVNRRRFVTILTAVGLHQAGKGQSVSAREPEILELSRNGWVPNNQLLPVLVYRGAIDPGPSQRASSVEAIFRRNGWPPQWRASIYDFDHYHSTAHEVLGVAIGQARLMLGGDGGTEIAVRAGDVLVLPAGTGHRKLEASADFLVVGAYPPDVDWDICKRAPTSAEMERMRHLKFPASDPVYGAAGSLPRLWSIRPKALAKAS